MATVAAIHFTGSGLVAGKYITILAPAYLAAIIGTLLLILSLKYLV